MKIYQASIVVALLLSSTEAIKIRQMAAPAEPVAPPMPSQSGWNTQANAIKKPSNATKCSSSKCNAGYATGETCCHAGDEVPPSNQLPKYPFPKPAKKEGGKEGEAPAAKAAAPAAPPALSQIKAEPVAPAAKKPVPPPLPSQSGWNTQANAIKKPSNATKCSSSKCNAGYATGETCCHAGDVVPKNNQLPAYPFVAAKKEGGEGKAPAAKAAAPAAAPALSQIKADPVAPAKPSQAGWNTQANAIKKPNNATACSGNCKAANVVPPSNQMPAYPFPVAKKAAKAEKK